MQTKTRRKPKNRNNWLKEHFVSRKTKKQDSSDLTINKSKDVALQYRFKIWTGPYATDGMLELRENTLRQAGCNGRRMSCRSRMYSVAIWRKTRRKSLTVKALNPFSPFISLAPNIKHAVEETVMGQILAAALFWSKSSYHSGLRASGTYCTAFTHQFCFTDCPDKDSK